MTPPDGAKGRAFPPLGLRVLVAEDHPVNRKVVLGLLERIGCSAESVTDGFEAIRARVRGEHDLILMDVQMPGLDGWSATAEIRRIERERGLPRLPILAMTVHATDADRLCCREAGMDGHVAKPITRRDLHATLAAWAGPRRPAIGPPPFDPGRLLERCDGDRPFALELIETALETFPGSIEGLTGAMDAGDGPRLVGEAHSLKGGARTMEAGRLAGLCDDLERSAGVGDLDASRGTVARIVAAWAELRAALEAHSGEIA